MDLPSFHHRFIGRTRNDAKDHQRSRSSSSSCRTTLTTHYHDHNSPVLRWLLFATVFVSGISSSVQQETDQTVNQGALQDRLVLTPWWDLTFAQGETVIVDCGFLTEGHPENATIVWTDPRGQNISQEDHTSRYVMQNTK